MRNQVINFIVVLFVAILTSSCAANKKYCYNTEKISTVNTFDVKSIVSSEDLVKDRSVILTTNNTSIYSHKKGNVIHCIIL